MMNPKNIPAFAGKLVLNRGIDKIICYVLIIDQSWDRPAVRKIFRTKFPVTKPFDTDYSGPMAALKAAVVTSSPFYFGIAPLRVVQLGIV
jgi:hypothetical protein